VFIGDLDPVPPLSPGARDLLTAHRHARAERRRLRASVDHRDVVIAEMEARSALERHEAAAKSARELHEAAMKSAHELHEAAAKSANELHEAAAKNEELEGLLAAVFASRSWRIGHAATRLFRRLSGSAGPTAPERWQSLQSGEGHETERAKDLKDKGPKGRRT